MYTDEKAFTAADVVSANFFEIGKVFVEEGVVGGWGGGSWGMSSELNLLR